MIYYSSKEPFDFNAFKTIRSFGENIYSGKITTNEADQEQAHLLIKIFLILQKIFMMVEN